MSNKIDDETLEYVGILAKLNIEGEEKEKASEVRFTPWSR